jgi:hypothetical protein
MTGSPQLITFPHKIINSGEALVHGKGVKPGDLPTGREYMVQKSYGFYFTPIYRQ